MSKVTLKDVATEAGVSYQTVSKVLNNRANVTAETEARIWAAIEKLNYRPNISARNLRTQTSNLIGYGWQQTANNSPHPILNHFLYSAIYGFEQAGYHLLTFLINSYNDSAIYQKLYRQRQVEGFILADTNDNDPRIRFMMEQNIPFATFGRSTDDWDFCWVDIDGSAGLRQVVNHLLERGHTRIGLISWPKGSRTGSERESGYLTALRSAGIGIDPDWIARATNTPSEGVRAIRELLSLPEDRRPTAVACVSDEIAIGAMNEAAAMGYTIGNDLAITGFDDAPAAAILHPALTTVRQPIARVGEEVVKLVLKQINNEPIENKGILLAPELIIRASS